MPQKEATIEVGRDEYILDAAYAQGYGDIPSTCRQGFCVACAAKLLEGEVDHSDANRFFDVDKQAGFVLICRAKPLSNLVIQTHQKKQMQEHRIANNLPTTRG